MDNSHPTRCAYLQSHMQILRVVALQFCVIKWKFVCDSVTAGPTPADHVKIM